MYGDPMELLAKRAHDGDRDAARALLPFYYPALKAVELSGPDGSAVSITVNKLGATQGHAGVTPAVEQP
jgi:hypothetical protein